MINYESHCTKYQTAQDNSDGLTMEKNNKEKKDDYKNLVNVKLTDGLYLLFDKQ